MGRTLNHGASTSLVASVAATFLLYRIPQAELLVRPLVWLSTLAHELGHGLTALLLGGRFDRLELFLDASGVAYTQVDGSYRGALVAAGGLVGPSFAAALCFVSARTARGARIGLGVVSVLLVLATVLWVRTLFGALFVLLLGLMLGGVAWRFHGPVARYVTAFLGVQLSLSVFSRSDYLFTDTALTSSGAMPSDVARIADALWLPYWFWGGVCGITSLLVVGVGLWLCLRGPAARGHSAPLADLV